jgi:hypothetical protein
MTIAIAVIFASVYVGIASQSGRRAANPSRIGR